MNRYDHIGKLLVCVDFNGVSPWARFSLEPNADVESFVSQLDQDVKEIFQSRGVVVELPFADERLVRASYPPQAIREKAIEDAEWQKLFDRPAKSPEQWEAEKREMQQRVSSMPLRELIDEHGNSIGGTTWDEIVDAELERRIEKYESVVA